jgi:predicted esterase
MQIAQEVHQGQPVYALGPKLADADAAVILAHGRGAAAHDILQLAQELEQPGVAFLAPQAAGNTWYPFSFLEPLERNEPGLSSALRVLADLMAEVEAAGIPAERIVLGGFSQGACLASEFAARNPRRYGGLLALSGGVIGPPGAPRTAAGSVEGMPVLVGCSDADPHIPLARVHETADVFRKLGGDVQLQIYPGMGHVINQDEIDRARAIVRAATN